MDNSDDLIARAEDEAGCRWDDPNNPMALDILFGAVARAMGKTPPSYTAHDDYAAGMLLRHRMSREYRREQAAKDLMAEMLLAGIDPDAIADLFGRE